MSDLIKKCIFFATLGCIMGLAIGIVLWLIGSPQTSDAKESIHFLIIYLVASAIYGMLAMGSSVVYDIEEWSITQATLFHFAVTLIGFYVLGLVEQWLTFGDLVFWIMTISFIAIYFVIWIIQYASYKHKISELNRNLEAFKATDNNK